LRLTSQLVCYSLIQIILRNLLFCVGDSLKHHVGMKFSAEDKDTSDKCAQRSNGAWWYRPGRRCAHSNLNGLYMFGKTNMHWRCVMWYHWKAQTYSLKLAEMKIRPYDI